MIAVCHVFSCFHHYHKTKVFQFEIKDAIRLGVSMDCSNAVRSKYLHMLLRLSAWMLKSVASDMKTDASGETNADMVRL